jgi:RNA polymerase sigma factor (sigma-70 family)
MSENPLDDLLTRVRAGDSAASALLYETYAPYLRIVVRRSLSSAVRTQVETGDVVDSVWADLLAGLRSKDWRFEGGGRCHAFLARLAHNRLVDRTRQCVRRSAHERPLTDGDAPKAAGPRPSELAQAGDLWARMEAIGPPQHRTILQLRWEGLGPAEIGGRTGLHPSSVRRILDDLARAREAAEGAARIAPPRGCEPGPAEPPPG